MTRKRFIKLMMANGVQRNETNRIARGNDQPYSWCYFLYTEPLAVRMKRQLQDAVRCIADGCREAIIEAVKSLECLREAIKEIKVKEE